MIRTYRDGEWFTQESLLSALGLAKFSAPIISVVGAGGKTTVVGRLAREYGEENQKVIITTTTHMKAPADGRFLARPDMEQFAWMLKTQKTVIMGEPAEDGKIKGFPLAFLEAVRILGIPMIIEADGARGLPCKVPSAHEPALWEKTMVLIGVAGLDAVGRPIKEVCHRPESAARLLGKEMDDMLEPRDIVTIGSSSAGLRKAMDPFMKFYIILNKADTKERLSTGEEIARLFREQNFHQVLVTADLLRRE